jgi:hypothetical protein
LQKCAPCRYLPTLQFWSKYDYPSRSSCPFFHQIQSSNDYFIKILFLLSKWFQTRRCLWEFPIGSYVKLSSAVVAILVGVLELWTFAYFDRLCKLDERGNEIKKKSSPLKLHGQVNWNLIGSIYVSSSRKNVHFVPIRWQTVKTLYRTFHMCLLPNFGSFGYLVSEEKIFEKSTNQ